jgi:glycosyltransferase involved in cell wall biosynthesis
MSNSDLNSKGYSVVSIVIPVFNNAESLPFLFEKLHSLNVKLQELEVRIELIFVDDGSIDNSVDILRDFQHKTSHVKIVKLVKNYGAVNASRTGLKHVSGQAFSILAADLQDPPEIIFEMCKEWKNGSKFVVCERVSRADPFVSRIFSRLHYFIFRKFVFSSYPKGGFDIALMDKSMLATIISSVKSGSAPLLAFSLGYPPMILKYDRPARIHGKSSWTFSKKFNFFLDLIFSYSNRPLRLISGLGVLVSFSSFIFAAVVVFNAAFNNISVPGFAALAVLTSFLVGLILLMLGIIGEYIWRIYEQVNNRPSTMIEYVIESEIH